MVLCDSCFTMPVLMRLTSPWSDNNADSHSASVWVCHMAESQHTQTLPCVLMVWHSDGNSCQKGPLYLSKQTAMVHGITCLDIRIFCISNQPSLEHFRLASRWHCNTKAEASVLILLYEKRRKIHHHYETCQPPVSSQIRQQIGGNESCTLIGDENRRKCRISG